MNVFTSAFSSGNCIFKHNWVSQTESCAQKEFLSGSLFLAETLILFINVLQKPEAFLVELHLFTSRWRAELCSTHQHFYSVLKVNKRVKTSWLAFLLLTDFSLRLTLMMLWALHGSTFLCIGVFIKLHKKLYRSTGSKNISVQLLFKYELTLWWQYRVNSHREQQRSKQLCFSQNRLDFCLVCFNQVLKLRENNATVRLLNDWCRFSRGLSVQKLFFNVLKEWLKSVKVLNESLFRFIRLMQGGADFTVFSFSVFLREFICCKEKKSIFSRHSLYLFRAWWLKVCNAKFTATWKQ